MTGKIALFLALCSAAGASSALAFATTLRRESFPSIRLQSSSDGAPCPAPGQPKQTPDSSAVTARHDDLLRGMARYFGEDMVDAETDRFYYRCYPQRGECEHVHHPIRDLAAAWDASKAFEFTNHLCCSDVADKGLVERVRERLAGAIKRTLSVYRSETNHVKDGGMYLHEDVLSEPPTIGHSALLLLGLCDSLKLSILEPEEELAETIDGLVRGILQMQLENGAFRIEFGKGREHDNYMQGIEFFPGEAMLSLIVAHELAASKHSDTSGILTESTHEAILPSMQRAFGFYSGYYYNTEDVAVNYNIWQVLAFARYHDALEDDRQEKERVKEYVLDMCEGICRSRSWRYQLARGQSFYANLETVEIACGLDALAEGIRVARSYEDSADLARLFERNAVNALYFLEWSRDRVLEDCAVGCGGLGYGGVQVFEQRLDVTGHAISALVKLRDLSVILP